MGIKQGVSKASGSLALKWHRRSGPSRRARRRPFASPFSFSFRRQQRQYHAHLFARERSIKRAARYLGHAFFFSFIFFPFAISQGSPRKRAQMGKKNSLTCWARQPSSVADILAEDDAVGKNGDDGGANGVHILVRARSGVEVREDGGEALQTTGVCVRRQQQENSIGGGFRMRGSSGAKRPRVIFLYSIRLVG